jgi:hypothetical protein
MMAVTDKPNSLTASGTALGYGYDENDEQDMFSSMKQKFNDMDTGTKVAGAVLGTAAVAGTVGLGISGVHAIKDHKENKNMQKEHEKNHEEIHDGGNDGNGNLGASTTTTTRSLNSSSTSTSGTGGGGTPASLAVARVGLNGRYRATFDGDEIACLNVHDDLEGMLTIKGFIGGTTVGKYQTDYKNSISNIHFMDADEQWPVNGDIKGNGIPHKTNIIIWSDGTRWDRIG